MKQTINLGLNKPESTDFYNIEHFNENADILDAKLKELSNAILKYTDVSVPVENWIEDTTYEAYPYKADIDCEEVTEEHIADVIFDVTEATSGNYAPINKTSNGIVSIYAKEIPTETIVIPTIKCAKVVSA